MANIEAKVTHDHDYCVTNENEDDAIDSIVENLVYPSPSPSDSLSCLSPTYSCDSGIDSFACDLAQEFGKEGNDILNLLLDEELYLDLNSAESNKDKRASGEISNKTPQTQASLLASNKSSKSKCAPKSSAVDCTKKSNAEAARENRKKKKFYVLGLEKEATQLRAEKNVLTGKTFRLEKKITELQDEVDYLKSVLANQSMLSKLLERVSVTPGVSLSTSFCSSRQTAQVDLESEKENAVSTRRSRKRACNSQKSQNASDKRCRKSGAGGVCLHVKENKVSLEFCHSCSKMAED